MHAPSCFEKIRASKRSLLGIVYFALFIDTMLMTTVVPILPEYLLRQDHFNETEQLLHESHAAADISHAKDDAHDMIAHQNVLIGLMFGSKALVQAITNPFVGPITAKIGYSIPLFVGFVVMFGSTLVFAVSSSVALLWIARAVQGVGSAATATAGMGMLAQSYTDDQERGSAMGIALGGLALGVMVGPPFGGALYAWSGKELPFLILAMLALISGVAQLLILRPHVEKAEGEASTFRDLLTDPLIVVSAGAIAIGNIGIAMLEPSLPLWMMESWGASSMERGAAFLPASIAYLLGTNAFGTLGHRIGRWRSALIGMVVIGVSLAAVPQATSVYGLIIPNACLGFSIGMIDSSMFPLMGQLVDLRHGGIYGSVYAIADASFCMAFAVGPFLTGPLVSAVGFPVMMYIVAIACIAYAPLLFLLRDPKATNQVQPMMHENVTVVKIDGNEDLRRRLSNIADELHHFLDSEEDDEFPDEFVFCGIPEEKIEVTVEGGLRRKEGDEKEIDGEEDLVLCSCPSFMDYDKCYDSHCKMVHFKPSFWHWEDVPTAQEQSPCDWLTRLVFQRLSVVPPSPPSPPYAPALHFPSPPPLPLPTPYFIPIHNPYAVFFSQPYEYCPPSPYPYYPYTYPTQPSSFYGGHY